ncbi:MAG: Rrf2 family transcriptional regulator [Pseudanabaenaceae cyanobacterium]|jgi:Rrf2 family iron-sulfur cluster assembly transcriptional regulator
MKLTRRGHYSVKAMLDLAMQPRGELASVRQIAQRQGIPAPYLEKLLIALRQAGLVDAVRGSQGGYRLKKSPRRILVGEILAAVGEDLPSLDGLTNQQTTTTPHQASDWVTLSLWQRLDNKFREAIYSIRLEDLYYDARSWQAAQGDDTNFMI